MNGQKHITALNMSKYKSRKNFILFFLYYIIMEPTSQNNGINAIKEARKLFNERRSNLPRKEINEIRKKLDRKEVLYSFLKEVV